MTSFIAIARSLSLILFGLYCLATTASAQLPRPQQTFEQRAFAAGERLVYAVSYLGIRGGTLVMEVQDTPALNGRPMFKYRTKAISQQPVTTFFPVDDRMVSIVDAETLLPYHLSFHKKEGKKQTDLDVTFDHAAGAATTIKDGREETTPIPPSTQHAFSALYYLRSLSSVTMGDQLTITVHHEKKNYPVQAKVEAMEELTGIWGRKRALRVVVTMPYTGIWLNAGNMVVWVSDTSAHVPLKIRAKMVIGSITADLIEGPEISQEFDDSRAHNSLIGTGCVCHTSKSADLKKTRLEA
jgi:hypothetical protein